MCARRMRMRCVSAECNLSLLAVEEATLRDAVAEATLAAAAAGATIVIAITAEEIAPTAVAGAIRFRLNMKFQITTPF